MDISRPSSNGFRPVTELSTGTPGERPQATNSAPSLPPAELSLEALQAALQALPSVDLDRVAAVRQALSEGRLDTSAEGLAADMLAYHRGSDQ